METQQYLSGLDENTAPAAPLSTTEPVTFEVAGLGERLFAYVLDGIYLYLIMFGVGVLLNFTGMYAESDTGYLAISLLSIAITFSYYAYYWRRSGQTPGKKDMGIRIVRVDGQPITIGTVLKRYLGYSLNTLIALLGWVALIADTDHRGWHDRWAGTMVVKKHVGAEGWHRQQRGRWRPAIALVAIAVMGVARLGDPRQSPVRLVNEAEGHFLQGDFDAAMIDIDSALSRDPNMPEAYVARGMIHCAQGDYQRGMANFDTALGLDPDSATAYHGRGFALFLQGAYTSAIKEYDKSLRLDSNLAETYVARGMAYSAQGDYQRGMEDFDSALGLDRDFAQAYMGRGFTRLVQEDYASAVTEFDEALRLDPNLPAVYFYRGLAHIMLDARELALADLKTHVRLAGDAAPPLAKAMIAELEATPMSQ